MRRVAEEPTNPKTRLHIFGFDSTIFRSPGPPPDASEHESEQFWSEPESLGGNLVPKQPNDNWYVPQVVKSFREAQKDPKSHVVVLTGRLEKLRNKVQGILDNAGLKPDELLMRKSSEPVLDFKTRQLGRLFKQYPHVKEVHFYEENQADLEHFQAVAEREGREFTPHFVADEGDTERTWADFLYTFYEGGAKQVLNTNPASVDRFPTVRADRLMETDVNFAERIKQQFSVWMSQGKPKAKSAGVLRRAEILAASRRVSTRYLLRQVRR